MENNSNTVEGSGFSTPDSQTAAKPEQHPEPLSGVLNRFISSIEGLATSFPVTTGAIRHESRRATKEFRSFLEEHATHFEKPKHKGDDKFTITFSVQSDHAEEAERLTRNMQRAGKALTLVPRSLFVSLVSAYDHFLGELIKRLLLVKPELLNESEKTMRFSDLMGFGSVEAARDFIIEKEVESILRESHSDHFNWMQSRFGIKLKVGLDVWPEFIEITERRNLFVHTGGLVSGQYLSICTDTGSAVDGIARGQQLGVSREYFDRSYEVLFEIAVKLTHVLWRKLLERERQQADQNLLEITYRLISEERYKLAIVLLDFGVETLKKHHSEDYRLRFLFNRAQAYKWSGDESRAISTIKNEDLSAAKPVFKLAAACICDDVGSAAEHIKEIGANGEIGLTELRQWPIFKRLRENSEFAVVVAEVFGEPLIRKDLDAELPVIIDAKIPEDGSPPLEDATQASPCDPKEAPETPAAGAEPAPKGDGLA